MVDNVNQVNQNQKIQETEQANKTAVQQELQRIADLKNLQNQTATNSQEQFIQDAKHLEALRNEKGYHAKLQKDKATKILSELADDLSKLGMELMPKTASKSASKGINDELDNMFGKSGVKEEKGVHHNLIKEAVKRGGQSEEKEKEQKEAKEKENVGKQISSPDVREAIQDYSGAYAQNLLATSPEAHDKLEDVKGKLKKKGLAERDIISIERAVKRSFGKEFLTDIQDSFIDHMFSAKNTFDFVVSERKLNSSYQDAAAHEELSGISADKGAIKDNMSRIRDTSVAEIKDYIRDAVESKLLERHLRGIDNRAEMNNLIALGKKVGFDFTSFLKNWDKKKIDLGLVVAEVNKGISAESKGISVGDVQSGGVGDKSGYDMTKDEEKELLINQLRGEFLKQALTGDPLSSFNFVPKIRKLKNGLIKLGLEMESFGKIEQEARTLAKYRTLEMLKDAFMERSTYYDLSGPSFNLLHNKIKGLAFNMEKLGLKLDKDHMDMIRDTMNRQMYDHTIIELKSAMALLETQSNPAIEKNVPLMVKLIERLRTESGFTHGLGEDIDQVIYRHNNNIKGFNESA
jgi:hypothetical protein